jgi:hypothetical protein
VFPCYPPVMAASEIDIPSCDANVMQVKVFNARLEEADLKRLAEKARRRGLSQTALLREWIRAEEGRTIADMEAWEARNLGNKALRIRRD